MPEREVLPRPRTCAECGIPVRAGDGGVRAFGKLFCSEECADDREGVRSGDTEGYYGGYGEDPLGGAW